MTTTIDRLKSTSPFDRAVGIYEAVKNKDTSKAVVNQLFDIAVSDAQKIDQTDQYDSDLAIAALDILGVIKYDGDSTEIHMLIESQMKLRRITVLDGPPISLDEVIASLEEEYSDSKSHDL